MKLLDCVLIGLVCFIIVYILVREMKRRGELFAEIDPATAAALGSQTDEFAEVDPATAAAFGLQTETFGEPHSPPCYSGEIASGGMCYPGDGFAASADAHTHDIQSDQAKELLNERTIGAPWYHPVAVDSEENFADAKGKALKPDDLLPKDMQHGWSQAYMNCKDLLANKNFVDTNRFKFSNEVLDTRNTKYSSLDIRKTPLVSHNPVSIWQKSPVEKGMWEYVRPALDD